MSKRSYEQFCGLAAALDVVGERWTLLIVRDLSLGPQRYSDLLAGLPGIGTGLLAERLRHLEDEGIVRRSQLPPPAATVAYALTDAGRQLADALLPLAVWGAHRLNVDERDAHFRPDWLFVTLRARFRPDKAVGVRDTYEFHVDGTVMHVRVRDGQVSVQRGPAPEGADATITTDVATLLAVGLGRLDPADAVAQGRSQMTGSPEALRRCLEVLGPGAVPPAS